MQHVKVVATNDQEKLGAVIFDEMSIKAGAGYDPSNDLIPVIEGFGDFGIFGRTQQDALALMIRGLNTRWKQPTAYVLSHGPIKII